MVLTSLMICTERRVAQGVFPDNFMNEYVVGLQFIYGAYDADGRVVNPVTLNAHGKVSANSCVTVNLSADEYLSQLFIAVDSYEPSINQMTVIITNRKTAEN